MIIDYSSFKAWSTCPALWYEKYINKREPRWPTRLRDDALCLGTLVHAGLEVWQKAHIVQIPEPVVEEVTPSKETLDLAYELIFGYTQHYPEERWPLILCEEPLLFQLEKRVDYGRAPYVDGLAKIDAHFRVDEPYIVESGQEGIQFTLSEGRWIHEYKTKSPDIPLGLYIQKWEMNMQASFQILALQSLLDSQGQGETVQGVLVNILEKPKKYIPKRKCKGCEEYYEYSTWIPTGDGRFSCPVCGNKQELIRLKDNPTTRPPSYYRIVVTRTKAQLDRAKAEMIQVGERMTRMSERGLESEVWQTENCIQFKRPCSYFGQHLHGVSTKEDLVNFQDVRDYRGVSE